ncbi:hypothetical protein [Flavobacterium sp.]|uniref:hypothetical protein n=1 Tax=Flavobacterium sp. TaxID=239 RepID=UPI0039E2C391
MKANTLKISLLLLISSALNAQTFDWSGKKTKITEDSEYQTQSVLLGDKLYNVKTRYNEKVYNTDVYVDRYDLKDNFDKSERNLSVEQPAMGLNLSTFNSIFPYSEKEFVAFYSLYNKTSRENELYVEKDDIDSGSKTKVEMVAKVPGKSGTNPGNFYVAQSANRKFYAIVAQPLYDKKINEKITLVLLDANFKEVKKLEYEFPFSSKQSGDQTIFVSDNGQVFLIKNIDLPKMKPYLSAYFWNTSANTVSEESLKLENDLQINAIKGQFLNNELYLNGTTDAAERYAVTWGQASPAVGIFAAKFTADGKLVYAKNNPVEKYKNLVTSEAIIDADKIWVIYDQKYKAKRRQPADKNDPLNYKYDYVYDSAGTVVLMIDNATGKMDWISNIKNNERTTENDNGAFNAAMVFLKNGKLSVIYNDTRNFGKALLPDLRRVPVIEMFDRSGKSEKKDIANPGIAESKENCFELDPSFKIQQSPGVYIVRTRCKGDARYGYLKF